MEHYVNPMAFLGQTRLAELPLSDNKLRELQELLASKFLADDADGLALSQEEIWKLQYKLEHPVCQELFLQLYQDKSMHAFLSEGDLQIFDGNSLLKSMHPKSYFIFWRPLFISRYAQVLKESILTGNNRLLKKIRILPFETDTAEKLLIVNCLKPVFIEWHEELERLEQRWKKNDIRDHELFFQIESRRLPELVNTLPECFQRYAGLLAVRLMHLAMTIFNLDGEDHLAVFLANESCAIESDPKKMQELETARNHLRGFIFNRHLLDSNQEQIQFHRDNLKVLGKLVSGIKTGQNNLEKILTISGNLSPDYFNSLPSELQFLSREYAAILRVAAFNIWNLKGDEKGAKRLLNKSSNLAQEAEFQKQLRRDAVRLGYRIEERENQKKLLSSQADEPESLRAFWPAVWKFGIFVAFLFALAVRWNKPEPNLPETTREAPAFPNVPQANSTLPAISSTEVENQVQNFLQLNTGDMPFKSSWGAGVFSDLHHSWIAFENLAQQDAVVCLQDLQSGKVIRNQYIRSGDKLRMKNIPDGIYRIKISFGQNWDPNLFSGKGGFTTRPAFYELKGKYRHLEVYDIQGSFMTFQIELRPPLETPGLYDVIDVSWFLSDWDFLLECGVNLTRAKILEIFTLYPAVKAYGKMKKFGL